MIKKKLLLTLAGIGLCYVAHAQTANHNIVLTIPTVTTVGLQGGASISLSLAAPSTPGEAIADATNNTMYLTYTSIKNASEKTKNIKVALDQNVPAGVTLKLHAAAASGGGGTLGTSQALTSATAKTLSTDSETIIDAIDSGYTGANPTSGHQLTYTLSASNYATLKAVEATTIKVTYTIADNQ